MELEHMILCMCILILQFFVAELKSEFSFRTRAMQNQYLKLSMATQKELRSIWIELDRIEHKET